jgi:hypothetical protein
VGGVPNAGTVSGILPAKVDATTRQILRKTHYDLGTDRGEYSTTYGDAFVRKPLDPDVWEEITE